MILVYIGGGVCNNGNMEAASDASYMTPAYYVLSQADLLKHAKICKCKTCQKTLISFRRMKPHQLKLIEKLDEARSLHPGLVLKSMMEDYSFDELFLLFDLSEDDPMVPQESNN